MKPWIDNFQRRLSYLRVSITDRCNLRCVYCKPLEPIAMLTHDDILRYEEILRIVRIGATHGISKVRVTGGEPLVRLGVYDFLKALTDIEGIKDVSLTTNGVLLKDNIDRIRAAGIKRINISLDSLVPSIFERISGRNHFHSVWEGILAALDRGFDPIKLNVVVMKGINDRELLDFAALSINYPFHVRFIEYMPIGHARISEASQMLTPEIKQVITKLGPLLPVVSGEFDGPAFRYRFENGRGEVGFISPISHHFCADCNRLRLTADGKLLSCLLSNQKIDLKVPLRQGCSDERISEIYWEAIQHKQKQHTIGHAHDSLSTPMSSIGG